MTQSSLIEEKVLTMFPLNYWLKRRVCLAVSGGADSVALLRVMANIAERADIKKNLFIVTINHLSRGDESDGDVLFVQKLGKELGIEVFVQTIDRNKLQNEVKRQGSWESAARTLRYQLLIESAKREGARFIVTAHHRDDQIETLLFRLFRGTGLEGLRGIVHHRVVDDAILIIRPLLLVGKSEIIDYLNELRQEFRIDSTNASTEYARNRIRHNLIPILNEVFANQWQKSLLKLANLADEIEEYFKKEVNELEEKIAITNKNEDRLYETLKQLNVTSSLQIDPVNDRIDVPLKDIINVSEEVLSRFFRKIWKERNWALSEMGNDEWKRLVQAVRTGKPTNQFPDNIFVVFTQAGKLRIERKPKTKSSHSS